MVEAEWFLGRWQASDGGAAVVTVRVRGENNTMGYEVDERGKEMRVAVVGGGGGRAKEGDGFIVKVVDRERSRGEER